jgi:hypothetical protein
MFSFGLFMLRVWMLSCCALHAQCALASDTACTVSGGGTVARGIVTLPATHELVQKAFKRLLGDKERMAELKTGSAASKSAAHVLGAGAPTQISVGGQRVLLTVLIDYIFSKGGNFSKVSDTSCDDANA